MSERLVSTSKDFPLFRGRAPSIFGTSYFFYDTSYRLPLEPGVDNILLELRREYSLIPRARRKHCELSSRCLLYLSSSSSSTHTSSSGTVASSLESSSRSFFLSGLSAAGNERFSHGCHKFESSVFVFTRRSVPVASL